MPFLLGRHTTFFSPVRKHGERENVVHFMKTGDWFISSNVDVTIGEIRDLALENLDKTFLNLH